VTRLTTCPDPASVAARASALIVRALSSARDQRGHAHIALSGGTTPGLTYELLALQEMDWEGVHVWFADERCVGPGHEDSNYRLASETLLGPAGLAAAQVHRMQGELGPQRGSELYTAELQGVLGSPSLPVLDLIVLGIGPDGHVASLFPGAPALRISGPPACIGISDSPKPPPQRLTLSLPVLRAARGCLLIATGASKADAVSAMLAEPSEHVPASLLRRERLSVIVDDMALPGGAPG